MINLPSVQPKAVLTTVNKHIITYRSGAVNQLLIADTIFNEVAGALSAFGVFGKMTLTNKGKFKIYGLNTPGLAWVKPSGNCSFNPVQGVTFQGEQHEPCQIQHDSEMCVEDLDNDCFSQFFDFNERGKMGTTGGAFSPEVNEMLSMIAKVETDAMATHLRSIYSSASQYLGRTNVELLSTVDEETRAIYDRANNNCMGYPATLFKLSQVGGNNHLNLSSALKAADCDGGTFTGDVEELYYALKAAARPALKAAMSAGGGVNMRTGKQQMPVMLVSLPIYEKLVADYEKNSCEPLLQQTNCIKREQMSVSYVSAGATYNTTIDIYRIHGTPVICDPYITYLDTYTNATTFFACITVPNNINFGASFGIRGDINNEQSVAMVIQFPTDILGVNNTIKKRADALVSVAIGSIDHIVATSRIVVIPEEI